MHECGVGYRKVDQNHSNRTRSSNRCAAVDDTWRKTSGREIDAFDSAIHFPDGLCTYQFQRRDRVPVRALPDSAARAAPSISRSQLEALTGAPPSGVDAPLVRALSARQIRAIRARARMSQAVFAAVLNTSTSTVQKWEIGAKRPSGPSLKLLNVINTKGVDVLS
jgi:DNA-binding transcriptional regulator YiaG